MLVLVIDTSIHKGTVGWVKFNKELQPALPVDYASLFLPSKPGHAEKILDRISLVLDSSGLSIEDIDLIALGKGPGTFTGLRIGYATAKAFHLSHKIPVVPVSTLKMVALSAKTEGTVVSLMDARRKELYMGAYKVFKENGLFYGDSIIDSQVVKPESVKQIIADNNISFPVTFAGDGVYVYPDILKNSGDLPPVTASSPDLCFMAVDAVNQYITSGGTSGKFNNPSQFEPDYLREPDAKKPKQPIDLR